jgi:Zn finger protein HypA/HybF involved in hydrogenase expression
VIEATDLINGRGYFYCECGDVLKPRRVSDNEVEYYCPSCDVSYRVIKREYNKETTND